MADAEKNGGSSNGAELSGFVPGHYDDLIVGPHGETKRSQANIDQRMASFNDIENYNWDPRGILKSGNLLENEGDKNIYKEELRNSTLEALALAYKDNPKLYNIYRDIHQAKAEDPNTSLFLEIQTRLENLADNPEDFEVGGEKLSAEETKKATDGLRIARRILTETAKAAGVFESVDTQIDQLQNSSDYERAEEAIAELDDNPERLQWTETISLNRASADFRGMSEAYIQGAINNMDYYMAKASVKFFEDRLKTEKDPDKIAEYERLIADNQGRVDELKDGRFLRNWGKPRPSLENKAAEYLKDKYEHEDTKGPETPPPPKGPVALTPEDSAGVERIRLERDGYNGVVEAVRKRTRLNPEAFEQSLTSELAPRWYEGLSSEQQGIIRSILYINWIAAGKRDSGQQSYEGWAGLQGARIERKDIANMWKQMPGFRIAMATFMDDIFVSNNNEFKIISGVEGKGYDILQDATKLGEYKDQKTKLLANHLKSRPEARDWAMKHFKNGMAEVQDLNRKGNTALAQQKLDEIYEKIASVSINTVDSLLFATGAYDSGNQFAEAMFDGKKPPKGKKATKINDSNISSDSVRALFQPGQKGIDKWREGTTWGGSLGEWMQDNFNFNRDGFADRLKRGQIKYLPRRMQFSILEMTDIVGGKDDKGEKGNLAELLMKDKKQAVKTVKTVTLADGTTRNEEQTIKGLKDYEGGADYINMQNIDVDELWGNYQDLNSAVVKVYEHMTSSSDPRGKRIGINELMNSLIKIRKNDKLRRIYNDDDFVKAAVGLAISKEGFIKGQTELLLDIPEPAYNAVVTSALMDSRLFSSVPNGAELRSELFRTYHAKNIHNTLDLLFDIYIEGSWLASRERGRRALSRKAEEELRIKLEDEEFDRQRRLRQIRRMIPQAS